MTKYHTDDTRATLPRRAVLAGAGAAGAALLGGCLGGNTGGGSGTRSGSGGDATTAASTTDAAGGTDWQAVEVDAVRGGETFTVGGLPSPTVVHSFAVWCPKCKRLSNELIAVADEYTVLGLNTDPNEDATKVRDYAEENDFGWRFAVAPTGLTDALVAEFGSTVVNAPSTPVIVVCGDGTTTFLSGGDSTRPTVTDAAEDC